MVALHGCEDIGSRARFKVGWMLVALLFTCAWWEESNK